MNFTIKSTLTEYTVARLKHNPILKFDRLKTILRVFFYFFLHNILLLAKGTCSNI